MAPAHSSSEREPIAVIGIGCRFPGGCDSPQAFWDLLTAGRDGIVEVPKDRWDIARFYDPDPAAPGKMYVKSGGFLQQRIDSFDALAFGIAPREAMAMDPQQRLLLEVSWEAIEDAGLDIDALAGSDTGVFVGAFMVDNMLSQLSAMNRELIGPQTAVSWTMSILSNRLSYLYDLRGPSITLDTACSSSLVSTHLGCQSLWRGECSLVLVGGVNVMHRPEVPISMCKGQFLATDGRCKSFDARGDGYGRGEGAGVVVLKPLARALRDGDQIYGLICGTGSNQDGRTNGITVPNPDAQAALIRQVCAEVGIRSQQIRYFEAHGTGTEVGDPLEAGALGAAIGKDRDATNPCLIGSVKANIGHLEAASGVAGLIKTVLCLKNQQIPPLANLEHANPAIPFAELGLRLPRCLEAMPTGEGPAYAGVNSFGYGGTNAHVILCEAPAEPCRALADNATELKLLPLSARSEQALQALAGRYLDALSAADAPPLADVCYSAGARRGHHGFRTAIVGNSRAAMLEKLEAFIAHGQAEKPLAPGRETEPVFVFTGMGPQWWAMGRELLQTEPEFRKHAQACDVIFQSLAGWSILAEITAEEQASRITQTQIAQPANFVIQSSLVALLRSWGIEPAAVVGHSVGEVTSAYVAGVLSLEDALRVSFHRSRIQKKAAGLGAMLAAALTPEQASVLTQGVTGVAIAAANSPSSVTLAGDADALEQIATKLESEGIFNRFLQVEVAYHSHYMDPLLDELRECLQGLRCQAPRLPLYSTVTGAAVLQPSYDAEYWCRNVRQAVLFAKATDALLEDGYRLFLEVGPHPVLSTSIKECTARRGVRAQSVATLRREKPEHATLLEGIGALYTLGYRVDWRKFYAGRRYVRLPSYPWQREVYWQETAEALRDRLGNPTEHPFLETPVSAPRPCWDSTINLQRLPYLGDHRVDGLVVLPGAAYVEAGLALHHQLHGEKSFALEDLRLRKALVLDAGDEPVLRVEYDARHGEYHIASRPRDEKSNWTQHAQGRLSSARVEPAARVDVATIRSRGEQVDGGVHYQRMRTRGLDYGPWFQGVQQLWCNAAEVLALIEGCEALSTERAHLHPSLLDACFQSLLALVEARGGEQRMYLPVAIRQLRFHSRPPARFYSCGQLTQHTSENIEGDLQLCDLEGNVLIEVLGLRCQAVATKQNEADTRLDHCLYQYQWQPAELAISASRRGQWLIFTDQDGPDEVGTQLTAQLQASVTKSVLCVRRGQTYERHGNEFQIDPRSKRDLQRLLHAAGECAGVAYLWGLDYLPRDPTGIAHSAHALQLTQALAESQPSDARLYMITRGVQQVNSDDACAALQQAPLVGLARVAANEHPELRCTIVDLDPQPGQTHKNVLMLAQELLSDCADDAIALREGERFTHRLSHVASHELVTTEHATVVSMEHSYALDVSAQGELQWRRCERRPPAANEVEIHIEAVGLVRADAHWVKGKSGGKSAFLDPAREILGRVTAVGMEVRSYLPGDRLVACVPGGIGSHLTVPVDALFSLPIRGDDQRSGTGLLSLAAAYYGLFEIAGLARGETLLILGALYNPGTIAMAKSRGARVIVASATEAEYAELEQLEIDLLLDAGAADFADRVRAATGNRGVDVVLNARSTLGQEWQLLAPYGRLIQLGAADADAAITLNASAAFERNLTLASVDIKRMMSERPLLLRQVLDELAALEVRVPATRRWPASQVMQALQQLDDHTGPLALTISDEVLRVLPARVDKPLVGANATYLITGGFGGFGLEIAKWLAAQGARHLVLVGRRGAATPEAQAVLKALQAGGTQVLAAAADIGDEAAVISLLQEVATSMPPLKGILHTAGVLDDDSLMQLTEERLRKVMAPKALGAWYLHQHTQDAELDFFVLFSSISALIGNANQANYVAANLFLDTLACHRRARGLAATSVQWGVLAEVGMAAANQEVGKHLERMGIRAFTAAQAMQALEQILRYQPIQLGVMDVDWSSWGRSSSAVASLPRFAHLVAQQAHTPERSALAELRRHLQELAPDAAKQHFTLLFAEQIASTLRLPPAKVDLQLSLTRIGGDSLMALELQARLRESFGAEVSTLELLKDKSLAQLAQQVQAKLLADEPKPEAVVDVRATTHLLAPVTEAGVDLASQQPAALLANLHRLSDDEVNRLYESMQLQQEVTP